jgi:hypothetical protein
MGRPVFQHGILAMQKAAAANKAALLIIGLVPIPPDELEWLKSQRANGIDYVACEHPDEGKDKSLKIGGIGHPSARLHRWWADCALKALAERGYATDVQDQSESRPATAISFKHEHLKDARP